MSTTESNEQLARLLGWTEQPQPSRLGKWARPDGYPIGDLPDWYGSLDAAWSLLEDLGHDNSFPITAWRNIARCFGDVIDPCYGRDEQAAALADRIAGVIEQARRDGLLDGWHWQPSEASA